MICNTCNKDKPESEFYFKNKATGKRNSKCKSCHGEYIKVHYKANKAEYITRARRDWPAQQQKTKDLVASLKLACINCNESHVALLDFHHLDPSKKETTISRLHYSRKKIIEEAKKCVVLCSNCHRRLHYDLRNGGHTQIRTEKQIGLSYLGIPNSRHMPQ